MYEGVPDGRELLHVLGERLMPLEYTLEPLD
jgi:hypothetical protein